MHLSHIITHLFDSTEKLTIAEEDNTQWCDEMYQKHVDDKRLIVDFWVWCIIINTTWTLHTFWDIPTVKPKELVSGAGGCSLHYVYWHGGLMYTYLDQPRRGGPAQDKAMIQVKLTPMKAWVSLKRKLLMGLQTTTYLSTARITRDHRAISPVKGQKKHFRNDYISIPFFLQGVQGRRFSTFFTFTNPLWG